MQRLVVARFRGRNDADAYRLILRQLLPTVNHVIIFDLNLPERMLEAQLSRPSLISVSNERSPFSLSVN